MLDGDGSKIFCGLPKGWMFERVQVSAAPLAAIAASLIGSGNSKKANFE
jgi:hypothetical protein